MECPHCNQTLALPEGEEIKLLTCESCGHKALPEANYCSDCGEPLGETAPADMGAGFDPDQRTACSDGMCIGIIGPDGKCTECGKAYAGGDSAGDDE